MDSGWLYNNQAGMLLENYENLLEVSVSDTIKFSEVDFLRSDYLVCEKTNFNDVYSIKRILYYYIL